MSASVLGVPDVQTSVPGSVLSAIDGAGVSGATLRDRVVVVLREAIVSGRIPPATRLSEPSLSREFKVSRGPIREAIRELATEGLVRIEPRIGTFVTHLDSREIDEAFAVGAVLEGLAARLAAGAATEAERRARLAPHLEALDAAAGSADPGVFLPLARRFHEAVVDLAGNGRLAHIHRTLNDQLYRLWGPLLTADQIARSSEEHRAVAAAIVAGRPAQAERLGRAHVLRAGRRLAERARRATARRAAR